MVLDFQEQNKCKYFRNKFKKKFEKYYLSINSKSQLNYCSPLSRRRTGSAACPLRKRWRLWASGTRLHRPVCCKSPTRRSASSTRCSTTGSSVWASRALCSVTACHWRSPWPPLPDLSSATASASPRPSISTSKKLYTDVSLCQVMFSTYLLCKWQ